MSAASDDFHVSRSGEQVITADDLSRHGEALMESVAEAHQHLLVDMRSSVSDGMYDGIKRAMADSEQLDKFWRGGFDRLTDYRGKAASRWVGQRRLTAFVTAIVAAGLIWLVKSGAIK